MHRFHALICKMAASLGVNMGINKTIHWMPFVSQGLNRPQDADRILNLNIAC
jgi:hypothetical protein